MSVTGVTASWPLHLPASSQMPQDTVHWIPGLLIFQHLWAMFLGKMPCGSIVCAGGCLEWVEAGKTDTLRTFLAGLKWLSVEPLSLGTTKLDVWVTRLLLTGSNEFFLCKNTSQSKADSKGGSLAKSVFSTKEVEIKIKEMEVTLVLKFTSQQFELWDPNAKTLKGHLFGNQILQCLSLSLFPNVGDTTLWRRHWNYLVQ